MFAANEKRELIRQVLEVSPKSVRSIDGSAPRDFSTIILKATAKSPDERYSTAGELADDLRRFLDQRPIRARLASPVLRARRWCQRNQRVASLAAIVFLLLSSLAVTGFRGQTRFAEMADAARRSLYVADVNRVQQYLRRGEASEAIAILNRHLPRDGEEDLRGIEWTLLRRHCDSNEADHILPHRLTCYAADFSPDGFSLATGEWLHRTLLWNAASGQRIRKLKTGRPGPILDVRFDVEGSSIITCSWDGTVRVWDPTSGESQELEAPTSERDREHNLVPHSLSVASDGKWIAASYFPVGSIQHLHPSFVRIWDAESLEFITRIDGWLGRSGDICFSPNSELLAVACADGLVQLIETETWTIRHAIEAHDSEVYAVEFSPDSSTLASTGLRSHADGVEGEIAIWNTRDWSLRATIVHHEARISSLDFTPDGKLLAAGSWDHEVSLWDTKTLRRRSRFRGHAAPVRCVCFSPDGRRLCTTSDDNTAKIWNIATLLTESSPRLAYTQHPGKATWMAFADEGRSVWSVDLPGDLRKWDVATLETLQNVEIPLGNSSELAVSPDNEFVAAVAGHWPVEKDKPDVVSIVDVSDGEVKRVLDLPAQFQHGVEFSPSHPHHVAVGTFDGIFIWDAATGDLLLHIPRMGYIKRLAFSPDGKRLAVALNEGRLKVFDTTTGDELGDVKSEQTWGTICVAYSPDGTVIATGGGDHRVKFWDAQTFQLLREVQAPNWIGEIAFSPDGRRFLTGGTDSVVRIWDLSTCQVLLTLQANTKWIFSAAFSPDGQTIAAASEDIFVWRGGSEFKVSVVGTLLDDAMCTNEQLSARNNGRSSE